MKTIAQSSIYRTDKIINLVKIFEKDVNIVVLERKNLEAQFEPISFPLEIQFREVMKDPFSPQLEELFQSKNLSFIPTSWIKDMESLIEIYSDLLGLEEVGFRLGILKSTLCPKFHVDFVGIRLLCTYQGDGTEIIDRLALNEPIQYLNDSLSSLDKFIQKTNPFDVILLKGEKWENNAGFGAIHRSPSVKKGECRIVMSLDMV